MPNKDIINKLLLKSRQIRKEVIIHASKHKASHLGGALSVVDILTALYFYILRVDPDNCFSKERDFLVFSKGHAALALYATLAARGFARSDILDEYYADGKKLAVHPVRCCLPGVEVTTGSLGHGLPIGVGYAYGARFDKLKSRIFVILGDGECDEGSIWEAAMSAAHFKLDNLLAIVDYNRFQCFGKVADVMNLEPFKEKWQSFGWSVEEIDGHDFSQIISVLERIPFQSGKPSLVIAHTIKGKGVPSLEDRFESHYLCPDTEEIERIIKNL